MGQTDRFDPLGDDFAHFVRFLWAWGKNLLVIDGGDWRAGHIQERDDHAQAGCAVWRGMRWV